jgi:hypothetical protein
MKKVLALVFLIGCGGGGSGDDDDDGPPDARVEEIPDAADLDAYIPVGGCGTADGFTFFLNKDGGDYTMGLDDPATNVSGILDMSYTLAPWPHANWAEIVACVRQAMAEYNVQIVETEPVTGPYTEVVFTGTQLFDQGVSSIAPSACAILEPHITYVLEPSIGDDVAFACEYALFTIGVVTTLDTSMSNCDWMTYGTGCTSTMRFVDDDIECGEFQAHTCRCTGAATQNTHDIVATAYGACPQP